MARGIRFRLNRAYSLVVETGVFSLIPQNIDLFQGARRLVVNTGRFGITGRPIGLVYSGAADTLTLAPPTWPYTIEHKDSLYANGSSLASLPVTEHGEVFADGEIADYPQVLIDGVAITTQADVKQRWPSGDVKHAILSYYVPAGTSTTAVVTYQNQATGNNTGYMSATDMTSGSFASLDQTITVTGQGSLSLRDLIQAGHYELWRQGSVCTEIHVVDWTGTNTRLGATVDKPFRARWYVQFWPAISKARVRFVGGIDVIDKLVNLNTTFSLTGLGPTYSKAFTWYGAKRHTKRDLWYGAVPAYVAVRRNLAYLRSAGVSPAMDPSDDLKAVSEARTQTEYQSLLAAAKDWDDAGLLDRGMAGPGGRYEIGVVSGWAAHWLRTWDTRNLETMKVAADLAGAWPVNYVETRTGYYMDRAGTVDALGKPPGLACRTQWSSYFPNPDSGSGDGPTDPGGTFFNPYTAQNALGSSGWLFCGGSHRPDFWSWLYLFTGDHYYLHQMQTWACFQALAPRPAAGEYGWRNYGNWSGASDLQARSWAWVFRERYMAHFCTPDDDEIKPYLTQLVLDYIAISEGKLGVTGTALDSHPAKIWAQARTQYSFRQTTLGVVDAGGNLLSLDGDGDPYFDTAKVGYTPGYESDGRRGIVSPWQEGFFIDAMYQAYLLGYPTGSLVEYSAGLWIDSVAQGVAKWMGNYRFPAWKAVGYNGGGAVATFTEMADMLESPYGIADVNTAWSGWLSQSEASQNYVAVSYSGSAAVTGYANGQAARDWYNANARTAALYAVCPHWALSPPGESTASRIARALAAGAWSSNLAASTPSLSALDATHNCTVLEVRTSARISFVDWASSMPWDSATRSAVYVGAGAGVSDNGNGNALLRYVEANNRFVASRNPTGLSAGAGMGHGYDNTALDVTGRVIYKKGKRFDFVSSSPNPSGNIYKFDADTGEYLGYILVAPASGLDDWPALVFMPTRGAQGSLILTDPSRCYVYDIASAAWGSNLGLGNGIGVSNVSVYLRNADLVVFGGGTTGDFSAAINKMYKLGPTGGPIALDNAPDDIGVHELDDGFKSIFVPHPDGERAVLFANAGIYILNPAAPAGSQWSAGEANPLTQVAGDGVTPVTDKTSKSVGFDMPHIGVIGIVQEAASVGATNKFFIYKPVN